LITLSVGNRAKRKEHGAKRKTKDFPIHEVFFDILLTAGFRPPMTACLITLSARASRLGGMALRF
jgi:hypothetical protein